MLIAKRLLAPGHASCKPLPVLTHDGPNRFVKFKLRRIRRDYWNVLCFSNSNKLRTTAYELLNNYSPKQTEFIEDYSSNRAENNVESDDNESNIIKDVNKELKNEEVDTTEAQNKGLLIKSRGFWIVYSKRFKDSIHILSVSDIATILKSFHMYNKDTGEYVVAVLELQKRVNEMDRDAFMDCLWVLSRRLKLNTQKNFFKKLAQHVPNILYSLDALDIVKVLWNLHNAGYKDVNICRKVYMKFMDHMEELSEKGISQIYNCNLSAACLAFGRFGYRNMDLYSKIEPKISKSCNAEVLFQTSWGFHLAAIDVTKLVTERMETLVDSLGKIPRWKVQVWKTILNGTNCDTQLKKTVDEYL
ncbi:hypothetical protein MACJ_003576 [Theileria orientalis]|uniref:Uncharacterized protein n=1 Tax=Theileria orientalis TaxID=68886 RepID=A0A976SL81_THEOR|nr:hypothetical protein MACJ_003576 [Theileria orientalis]